MEYLTRDTAQHPNFARLAAQGATATQGMYPPYISKTFPSHYSMATGLHLEDHGILGNEMYDPSLHRAFDYRHSYDTNEWFKGEPVWVTAERHDVRSAVYFWPGSEAIVKETRPSNYSKYDQSVPFTQRVEIVKEWLQMPETDVKKPSLILAYFHEPDSTGHAHGPDSAEVKQSVIDMDGVLGQLLDVVEMFGANLVVVSDHGMAAVTTEKVIVLDKYIDATLLSEVTIGQVSPFLSVHVKSAAQADLVVNDLKKVDPAKLMVLKRADIPEEWHIKHNDRVGDVVAVAQKGWSIKMHDTSPDTCCGSHGFAGDLQSMRAIFYASGPSFLAGGKIREPFHNVDVYPLLCHLLRVEPAPNNGTLSTFFPVLKRSPTRAHWSALGGFGATWTPSQDGLTLYPATQEVFPLQKFDISVTVPVGLPGVDTEQIRPTFFQEKWGERAARTFSDPVASLICKAKRAVRRDALFVILIFEGCMIDATTRLTVTSGRRTASVTWRTDSNKLFSGSGAKNAILFVGDGMSLPMLSAARLLLRNKPGHDGRLPTDTFPFTGTAFTHSIESIITDSAAGASALNTGHKTANGLTGCYPDGTSGSAELDTDNPRVETTAEYLKRWKDSFKVGVVSTASVVDATPAGVWGHCANRSRGTTLALQGLDMKPDVILGGGQDIFDGAAWQAEGLSSDPHLVEKYSAAGYTMVHTAAELRQAKTDRPQRTLGLFAPKHLETEIDRTRDPSNTQPPLNEMATTAIDLLHEDGGSFFLMVEAAAIDKQAHACDTVRMLGETLEMQNTISSVQKRLEELGILNDTLIVVTSDHATGGFDVYGTANTDPAFQPDKFNTRISMYGHAEWPDWVTTEADPYHVTNWEAAQYTFAAVNADHPGYTEDFKAKLDLPSWWLVQPEQRAKLQARGGLNLVDNLGPSGHIEALKAAVHTGSDVMVYASGPGSERFSGGQNNTNVFFHMLESMMPSSVDNNPCVVKTDLPHQLAVLKAENMLLKERTVDTSTSHDTSNEVSTVIVVLYALFVAGVAFFVCCLYNKMSLIQKSAHLPMQPV